MRAIGLWPLAGLSLFLAACVDGRAPAPVAQGCMVTHVTDGDTLRLSCAGQPHRVRLLGIDTPEIFHPRCAAELAMGEAARTRMTALVASGPVTSVRFQGRDRYGRDLARVSIGGQDVSALMLGSGLASPYDGHRHPDWCGAAQ